MTLDKVILRAAEIEAELADLAALDELDEAQESRYDELTTEVVELAEKRTKIETRDAARIRVAELAKKPENVKAAVPQFMRETETDIDPLASPKSEVRDAALKLLEKEGKRLAARQIDHVDLLINTSNQNVDGSYVAKRLLITETPAYRSAFLKGVTRTHPRWTEDEARALSAFEELESRTMSEGTTTAGGFGVPVLIDPSIILTSGAGDAPIIALGRHITITTNAWKGVSSVGAAWSYDLEGIEVSDDSVTLAQPVVTAYMARGFIPYSIEVGDDYPGFAAEMSFVLNQGLLDLMASQSATGSGTGSPWGIFTAIDAAAGNASEISVTTAGAVAAVDAMKLWDALPERFKANATWVANSNVYSAQRRTSGDNAGLFTVDLSAGGIGQLRGRPTVETDYAPAFTAGTTSNQNIQIVGDFRHFVVVQRAGMTVELLPLVLGTTSNRPTGERGWFAHTRHGFDSVADNAFRLLKNP